MDYMYIALTIKRQQDPDCSVINPPFTSFSIPLPVLSSLYHILSEHMVSITFD